MAKQNGLGAAFYFGGVDLSGTCTNLAVGGGPALLDVTTINQSGYDRIGGKRDGKMDLTFLYDPLLEHPTLSALPTADTLLTFAVGTTVGTPAACLNAKQVNYDGNRGTDGAYTFTVNGVANSFGLEWGNLLTAGVQTDTVGTNGTGFDTGASASFGAQAYLHVMSVTGTSVTVKIQDSADNVTFADVASLAFTAVTPAGSPTFQRVAISNTATVRRYVRCVSTGTFSNAQYSVILVKNMNSGVVF